MGGAVGLAVHCVKDVPGVVPVARGTVFAAHLRRDSLHDAPVEPGGRTLDRLPPGSVVGTSPVRRVAQLARTHPRLATRPIRGNANTRLAKLDSGEYDALLLAVCGLERIGAADRTASRGTATPPSPRSPGPSRTAGSGSGPGSSHWTARTSWTPT